MFLLADGILQTMSPEMIVQGFQKIDFIKRYISIGEFYLVYTGNKNTLNQGAYHIFHKGHQITLEDIILCLFLMIYD